MKVPTAQSGRWWMLLAALAGAFVMLYGANSVTRFKSYSPDSMNYVDVARNLLDGRGLVQSTIGYNHPRFLGTGQWPEPFIAQPPAYPAAIAALGLAGIEPANGALILPVLALAAVLLLSSRIAYRIGGTGGAALAIAALVWFVPLTDVCRRAWSDSLATALALGGLLLLLPSSGAAPVPTARRWIGLGVLCGLAFATRYALVSFCLFAGLLAVLPFRRNLPGAAGVAWRIAAGAGLFVALPLVHNLTGSGHLLPAHNPSTLTFGEIGRSVLEAVLNYTDLLDPRARAYAVVALLLAGLLLPRIRPGTGPARGAGVLVAWVAVYTAFVVWQRWRIHFDEITPRLLLPALVPLVVAAGAWLGRFVPEHAGRFVKAFAALALVLAIGREVRITLNQEPVDLAARIDYSPRLVVVRDRTEPDDVIIGNDPLDVAFYLKRKNLISFSPHPYTDYPAYLPLLKFLDDHGDRYGRAFIIIRDFSGRDETRIRESFGPFIADLLAGRADRYPRIHSVGILGDTHVFKIDKAIVGKWGGKPET